MGSFRETLYIHVQGMTSSVRETKSADIPTNGIARLITRLCASHCQLTGRHDRRVRSSVESLHPPDGPRRRLPLQKGLLDNKQRIALDVLSYFGYWRRLRGRVRPTKQLQ